MSDDNRNPGILLGRHDGVIVVLDAVPVPADVMADLNRVLDALGAPPRSTPEDTSPTSPNDHHPKPY